MKIIWMFFVLATIGCNGNSESSVETNDSVAFPTDSSTSKSLEIESSDNDSIINIRFAKDSTSVTVSGKMNGMAQPVNVYIPVKQGKRLSAVLVPEDSIANIRISHLYTPDGKSDGPFGRELKHKINQQGTYKLTLSENQMQGDEWKGKFTLTIKVE